jgi:chaperonin GroES
LGRSSISPHINSIRSSRAEYSIIIPDSAKEKPQHAEVVAVGSGKLLEDGNRAVPDVKAGDKILFGKYSGSDIRIEGDEYLILREDEILGVFGNE